MDLRTTYWFIFSLVVFVDSYVYVNSNYVDKWKLCLVESVHTAKKIRSLCPKLVNSPFECIIEADRFGCLRQVVEGDVDCTILEPEELVAIRNYNLYSTVLVTNELRLFSNEPQRFQVVAIGHKDVYRIWDTRGKRLCHPGFDTVDDWTKPLSMYFENLMIRKECDPNKTLLENRVHALSNYLEMACIAGPWSSDTTFDYYLKSKYRNLCAACENPASCYSTDKYYGRQGALLCLTDNVGDVAWSRLDDARAHFKAETINKEDYKFLCEDGTVKPLNFDEPCIWITKPWPVIVAKSQKAAKIVSTINLMTNTTIGWERNALQLMENYYIIPANLETLETAGDYLHRFPNFLSANVRSGCHPKREVVWCLTSYLEKRKCTWMRDAAIAYGVEPMISCFQEDSREMCLKSVQNRQVDIFMARPEDFLKARKEGLKPLIHAMTNKKDGLNRIAAVINRNATYKIMKDLRGARASFTGYRSVGWNAFTTLMRNESGENWDCSDTHAISKFFKDSCVLGWNKDKSKELPANLYSLCKKDAMEQTNDDLIAFKYLTSGLVDVAFVNLNIIEKYTKPGDFYYQKIDHKYINNKPKYRLLGPTLAEAIKGVPYLLAWIPLGTIMAHENITDLRRQEIYSMLLEMDNLFGKRYNGQTPSFSLYKPFGNKTGIIFPESTSYLELHGRQVIKGRSYDEIVEDVMKQEVCSTTSEASARFSRFSILPIYTAVVVVLSQLLKC